MSGASPDHRPPTRRSAIPRMSSEGYESFVVRVLVAHDTGDILSGHVTHLTSGQQLSFSRLDAMLGFIRRLAATATCTRSDGTNVVR